ncbi:MAG: nickel pincer cofactor biosynthesis protein LarC [Lachnospiraceae bacterium]|nr:nickel pincer cofactor biosynthesis protein LarC [Lachnospiraceae bacterium]
MKTLYIDCGMGAAGDMLTAALLDLFPDKEKMAGRLNALGIPGVEYRLSKVSKCGIGGYHMDVIVNGQIEDEHMHEGHGHSHDHGHHHMGMHGIEHIVRDLGLSADVEKDVLAVYKLIADAESEVHGVPVSEIHFHEVGTMDAVADIVAVCYLLKELSVDEIAASPVNVGSGSVHCAHGILPVPAPATALILKGIPIYNDGINGELTTPTGAALLKYYVNRYADMPKMTVASIGYGMGKKDFERANCVRMMLGETMAETDTDEDTVIMLSCNVDDMTAEETGFATEQLFEGGALEVYTVAVGMKKNRPGTLIRVICTEDNKENIIGLIFKHTTTIGIRESVMHRYILSREAYSAETPYGTVHIKRSSGYGTQKEKAEYEDLARIARNERISLREASRIIEKPKPVSN